MASSTRTSDLVTAALLAALLCVSASLQIPLQPVPITLQFLIVALAALLLSPGWAAAATGLYVALGAVGLPVFAGQTGGLGVVAGPTGGYLIGFVVGASMGALVRTTLIRSGASGLVSDVATVLVALFATYGIGTVWLAVAAHMGPVAAFTAGVAPFVAFDAVKGAVAITVAAAVRRATNS